MTRFFLALLILLSLYTQSVTGHEWRGVAQRLEASVYRMAIVGAGGSSGCSAWLLNAERDIVVTAGHCAPAGVSVTVGGRHAELLVANADLDVAVLSVRGIRGTPLQFRSTVVTLGMPVATIGYPMRSRQPIFRAGWVAGTSVTMPDSTGLMLDLVVQAGQSGSPVVDSDGRVVTMVRRTFTDAIFRSITMGMDTRALWNFVEEYLPTD
jgi:V8-like Glu-specific endopeptidase